MGVSCSTCEDANSEAAHEASKNIANQSLDQNPYVVRSIESNSRNWNNHQEIPQLISQQEQYNQTSSQRPNSNLVELPLGSTQPEIKSIQPVQIWLNCAQLVWRLIVLHKGVWGWGFGVWGLGFG